MSDRINKCTECGEPAKNFAVERRGGPSSICACPTCGHRYELYFLPGSKTTALLLEDLGPAASKAAATETAGHADTGVDTDVDTGANTLQSTAPAQPSDTDADTDAGEGAPEHATAASATRAPEPESRADAPSDPTATLPADVNRRLGRKLHEFRMLRGLSQDRLARKVGITFQQVQKYEKGTNRIAADRLFYFSFVLDVPVSRFFEDMEQPKTDEMIMDRQHLAMIRALRMAPVSVQKEVYQLVRSIARSQSPASMQADPARDAAE